MPDTMKRVRLVGDLDVPHGFQVLVDDEPLRNVTRVEFVAEVDNIPKIKITLIGVDVDLEGAPEYLVKVVGPSPKRP